jgi:hypothetical protein
LCSPGRWPVNKRRLPTEARTPALYERKTAWRRDLREKEELSVTTDNYVSAREHPEALRAQFADDTGEGVMVTMTQAAASAEWGKGLCIASQGARLKSLYTLQDEYRIVHDATHKVEVNLAIKVRDQARRPTHLDAKAASFHVSAEAAFTCPSWSTCKRRTGGFRSAAKIGGSRRARSARTTTKSSPNTVGTFGVASAGYWWAKLFQRWSG